MSAGIADEDSAAIFSILVFESELDFLQPLAKALAQQKIVAVGVGRAGMINSGRQGGKNRGNRMSVSWIPAWLQLSAKTGASSRFGKASPLNFWVNTECETCALRWGWLSHTKFRETGAQKPLEAPGDALSAPLEFPVNALDPESPDEPDVIFLQSPIGHP